MLPMPCTKPRDDTPSSTNFRSFVDRVLEANAAGGRIKHEVSIIVLCAPPTVKLQQSKRRYSEIINRLLADRRELNAHYGWVLASDARLVYKSMGGQGENGAAWARQWMKAIFREYERVGRDLNDAKTQLEEWAERAHSGVES
ncbi:hypothetical protein OPT61_g190 [Boeremia exigua]|uniref:Uncharacterized protein n=1 Tax=Boeremia exigua TaxID=749465 RepID=A0ACC2IUQ6_9PLEO|nr:hypothetical protein OPT61_g190 [Boeremia exigua]